MFKKVTQFSVFCVLLFSTIGCTSAPTPTHADIPLVHSSLSYSLAPEEQAINIPKVNSHNRIPTSFSVSVDGILYHSTKYYISATGNKCIRFTSAQEQSSSVDTPQIMTTCQRNGQWRVIAPLVAQSSENG